MRMTRQSRKAKILSAATSVATATNYATITRREVAEAVRCTEPLITHYYKSMGALRLAVLMEAIEDQNHDIIVQAMVNNDPWLDGVSHDILSSAWAAKGWEYDK